MFCQDNGGRRYQSYGSLDRQRQLLKSLEILGGGLDFQVDLMVPCSPWAVLQSLEDGVPTAVLWMRPSVAGWTRGRWRSWMWSGKGYQPLGLIVNRNGNLWGPIVYVHGWQMSLSQSLELKCQVNKCCDMNHAT